MVRFIEGEIDVLVSTTIIENGIDIQTANTIFIDEADVYGLSELHQLRGRVGRYKHQAYCYLVLPVHRHINPEAEKRLQALVEFSDLGAGFQIAMRDLEIRGAGNILGPEQSGHIAAVGYDMYCRLLERTVRRLRDEIEAEPVHVEIDLAVQAFVPEDYMRGEGPRLEVYRRVSQALTEKAIDELGEELADRFGAMPAQVRTLLDIQKLRVLCAAGGIESVSYQDHHLILEGRESMRKLLENCPTRVSVLDARTAGVSLVDPRRRMSGMSGASRAQALGDEDVFRIILEWLTTGTFPLERLRGAAKLSTKVG
jgi:transcription-repair coupling factor (superfamily II helicase)